MKKSIFSALLLAGILAAGCTHDEPSSNTNQPSPSMRLDTTWHDTVTISFARAFAAYMQPMEARTRAGLADVVSRLDVWLIQGDNVTEVHQTSGDADFGLITLALDRRKEYTMKAVAHKCSAAAAMTDDVVSFPEGEVKHTLYACHTFKPDTISAELPVNMQRIVGSFKLSTTDSVPSRVYTMRFVVRQCPHKFLTTNLTGTAKADRTVEFSNFARKADGTNTFTIYVMPDELTTQHVYDIEVVALRENGDVVESRTFTNVPIRANYRTQYQGAFFVTRSAGFTFYFDDWNDLPTVEF